MPSVNLGKIAPSVTVTTITGGHNVAIETKNTTASFDVMDGADGVSPTISIGTVTTGNPGTNAAVSTGGTASNVKLNFTIPAGLTGAQGVSVTGAMINSVGHLIITLTNPSSGATSTVDAGFAKGDQGARGIQGVPGQSAYEAAVEYGYEGTEAEFYGEISALHEAVAAAIAAQNEAEQYVNQIEAAHDEVALLSGTVETLAEQVANDASTVAQATALAQNAAESASQDALTASLDASRAEAAQGSAIESANDAQAAQESAAESAAIAVEAADSVTVATVEETLAYLSSIETETEAITIASVAETLAYLGMLSV